MTPAETESWLEGELEQFAGDGVDCIQLRRLRSTSLHSSETWAWMVELDCRTAEAARAAVDEGPGLMLLGDLRMLGMRPSVALIDDSG